jgi:SAM-dependent methyltransferase
MTKNDGERDYVLGTHDEEIERLGLQHRVWRPRVLDAWRRAGFSSGQTLLDVGAGPGYGTLDLAEIAGPTGRVVALERSRRFLDALEEARRRRGLDNIEGREIDLDEGALPDLGADGAWCRWIFAFVRQPRSLLSRLARALRPGAALVIHEYFDYSTWRLAPPTPEIEEFVRLVMESWRASGGEPDVGLQLPRWLDEAGFAVRSMRPFVDIVARSDDIWRWPASFLEVGLDRLVDLGHLDDERARAIAAAFAAREKEPNTFMITPAVLEVAAVRI